MTLIVNPSGLLDNEYQKIIYDWNNTAQYYPCNKTLISLFEEQVSKAPEHIAIVYRDQTFTYHALNQASNQLARKIQAHYRNQDLNIAPDTLITLCLDRTPELLIGMLAILKMGAAYVPIDPSTPAERLRFMLEDTDTRLVLTQQSMVDSLLQSTPKNTQLLPLDTLNYQFEADDNCEITATPSSLAYVIYTSGTTGLPKGVMITHRNIINYYANVSPYFDNVENIDFSTSIAFDLSVTTTLIPLLCGKKIVIYPGNLRHVEEYIAHLQQSNIHFIKSTPSFLTQAFSLPQSTQIKVCFVGGEKLLPTQLHCLLKHCDAIYDEYGPTENTVGTLLIQKSNESPNNGLIGKPYFNHKVYVLDENQKPVQAGVIGELYIGGAGLARGYLNQAALTQARFILNPFATAQDNIEGYTTLYKTGDLVRWLPDGNLEYIGRNDFQVKIRGYRIELNEIEHALSTYTHIMQSVVLARENTLIAYYLSETPVNEDEIIAHLKCWLPEYMLPKHFVHMNTFPLTINGKIDREALLQQQVKSDHPTYIAPKTALEKQLCTLWQEVLGLEKVGITDDFFKLGGDSIKCMEVMSHLLREGIDCRVRDIFTHRCIQQLATVLRKNRVIHAESGVLTGEIGLLPVQSWFFEQSFSSLHHWNQSFLVRVPPLSIDRLNAVLPKLIEHHDMLRVCFLKTHDGSRQQIYGAKNAVITIKQINIAELTKSPEKTFTAWQSEFDIEKGPLWQIGYITGYADGSARLYFAFHHLIIDTVSWRILIEDIKRLYAGETLGDKGSSYRQWVNAICQYTQKHPKEYLFWQAVQDENFFNPALSTMPYYASFELQADLTQQLIGPANKAYHTEINDLLLTALALTLSSYFGRPSHRITLEAHGREEIDETLDISRTVGWFTSLYPVVLTAQKNITSTVTFLKDHLHNIPNKGIGYGAYQYASDIKHTLPDLPDITFNYLGQFDNKSGYWQVADGFVGECVHPNNRRPYVLDILGSVINGSLHFSLSSYLSQEACEQIASSFEKQLISLTTHCLSEVGKGNILFTPSDFPSSKINQALLDTLQHQDKEIEAITPANSLQQGFIYHSIKHPENDAYRVQLLLDYYCPLNLEAYKNAWDLVIATHPALRTYFNWDERFIQIVRKHGHLDIQLHDFTSIIDKEQALAEIQIQDRATPFDFTKPSLMRLHLIQFDHAHFVVLQNAHHSILDGWSTAILLNQVHRYYLDLLYGNKPDVVVDRTYLQAQTYIANHHTKAAIYWDAALKEIDHINDINPLLSSPIQLDAVNALQTPRQSILRATGKEFNTLKQCVKETGLTLQILVQFAWHKLLQIYTGDSQTIVGTTVSGRTIPISGIANSVGLHINTLPLMMTWDDNNSVLKQLQVVESQLLALNDHCFAELAHLQKGGNRLFHSLIIAEYDNAFDRVDALPFHSRGTIEVLDYALALIVHENQDGLTLRLKYDEITLSEKKAEQLLSQLQRILGQIPDKINAPHHEITILSDADYQQIIYDWNATETHYPHDKTVHRLFEEQVLKTPDAIALVFDEKKVRYQALNDAANQLAHFILAQFKNKPVRSNPLIPICFDHSIEMVICILAVLKSGAAYVPIDPNYPENRINAILEDIGSAFILTSQNCITTLKKCTPENTSIIVVNNALYENEIKINVPNDNQPTDLAYVIYTSGTTGLPKGVMISHQNVTNYLSSITRNEAYQHAIIVDCSSSIAFDATVAVLLAPLVSGKQVVLCTQTTLRDTHLYLNHVRHHSVDLIRMTPSYLSALLATHDHAQLAALLSQVRCLIVGGEKANLTDIQTWMGLIPHSRVINHYGPTETTVACAMFTLENSDQANALEKIPLGKPAHNHQFYVLDRFLHPVAIGVTGELYVSGAGLAQGYFNQPELTKERFILNPFNNNTRLYKTGDLVQWLPDGNIVFIGRNDFQIKIRGYRIELFEIEKILLRHNDIQQCVVIVHDEKLAAYYVAKSALDSSQLKNDIEKHLPNYMVPSTFIALDSFPLTANGKLDRKALPKPIWSDDTTSYVAPQNELESLSCKIWQDVLGITRVGIHDDFFKLGGHSILAVHASHRMSQATHLHVAVTDLFKYRTISQLCAILRTGDALIDIKPTIENIVPLSFYQERLWFIEQYEGGTDAYHIPLLLSLDSKINISALKQALQAVVERHEVLRTLFLQDKQGVYQQQVKEDAVHIIENQISESYFLSERQTLVKRPFDLTSEYPIRICIFTLSDKNTQFLLMLFHHVAFDAWSKHIFMSELKQIYHEILNKSQSNLPPLAIQYKDFSIWQRHSIAERMDTLTNYWRKKLAGYESFVFPTDYVRPQTVDYRGDRIHFQLSETHTQKLKRLAESNGLTLYTVLLSGFAILLSKYTGQYDLLIGTPTSNRQHPQLATLIGFFVNLLPLRIQLSEKNSFLENFHLVNTNLIEAQQYQDLPFSTLVEHLQIERETSRHPLFQILFNIDYSSSEENDALHWSSMPNENDYRSAKVDLSVSMQDRHDGLYATVQYATSLFKRETIERFSAHYEFILTNMIESLDSPIQSYSILTPAEQQKIMHDWNATDQDYPHDKTIHQLFEEQALKTPEKIALVYENAQLTYRELNEKSNQLALLIRDYYGDDLRPDTLIAFCLNRSLDMIISLFAILKTGAAYVPIEPHSPPDRIRHVLNDTKSSLLLTHTDCVSIIKEICPSHTQLLIIDQLNYQHKDTHNLPRYVSPTNLAYVIYTSGTTGLPKGVMVMHQGVTNIVYHIPKKLFLTQESRVLQFASIAFDAAALQIFNPLTIGATLFIAPEKMRKDADGLAHFLKQHKITYAGLPPVLLAHLNPDDYPDLSTLVVAGESANPVQMKRWRPGRYLINAYGPTENTIGAALHQYELTDSHTNIGRPLANVKAFVLDQQLMPVPIGVTGELYLGGAGVARGYLNQAELTQERFVLNPFEKNTRLYKTGDLVRWLSDGSLEFIGRNDFQVKIRGYRIELNEIEQVILKNKGVQQCTVIVREEKLLAYYVNSTPIHSTELKNAVEKQLPSYMVPNIFIALDAFPLTNNGKLDKKALPEPLWSDETTAYVAPRDELESLTCKIWQTALNIERIGVDDDFFRLGGHSILAVHVSHQMSQATQRHIAVTDLFKYKTIAQLCATLRTKDALVDIAPIAENNAPLSFAQERLWFIEQYEGGTDAYHIPLVLELNTEININALKHALQAVVTRHEVLRTIFVQNENGIYHQEVKDNPLEIIEKKTNQSEFLSEQKALIKEPFDLRAEYPIRIFLFNLPDKNKQFLMIIFHHVAFDAWSKNIFMSELYCFYSGNQTQLPPLHLQYNDFSIWQRNAIAQRITTLMTYWETKLNGHELLAFPTDYPRPQMMDYRGDVVSIELSRDLLAQLQAVADNSHVTLYTMLLSGFALLLSKYTGQTDLLIGMPIVNREHAQLSNLIGLFVNSLVLRIQMDTSDTLESAIQAIQKNMIEAQWHQDLPFEQLINGLNLVRDTSRHPLFQTLFTVYENDTHIISDAPWKPAEFRGLSQTAKFDLAVSIQTSQNNAKVSLQYASALFKRETIVRFAMHYERILTEMLKSISLPLKSYSILSTTEYQQLIYDWNATAFDYPRNKTIHAFFVEQAEKTPDNIALIFENEKLTYCELDEKSNQLAHFIHAHYKGTLKPETLIGLCVERSLDLIIGILGILKSGAAYVPIDPSYPENRIEYIVNDTGCELILTHEKLRSLFHTIAEKNIISIDRKTYQDNKTTALPIINQSTNLAYVMYTSGTTGFPKGVMVEHRSVVCLLHSQLCDNASDTSKATLWTNIVFDVSVYEIFSILFTGGELHILTDEVRLDDKKLFHYIINNHISSFYLPPFFVEKISTYLLQLDAPVSIQKVLLSVEPIQVAHLGGFTAKNIDIINAYGPTETTVFSTAYHVTDIKKISAKRLPIGAALRNEQTYILDAELSPVPIGVLGELYLGGEGLSRGYWKKPDLTAERFIPNPFVANTTLYKTGDLVRWLPDGTIEYSGRRDFQVKIHGMRIELGEIEQNLIKHPGIDNSVVLVNEKRIIAYYTGQQIDEITLRRFLSTRLPDYMQPVAFIHIEKLPLHANGKLNRGALPLPTIQVDDSQCLPPRNALDKTILLIWKDILGSEKIGITDDFFALGGDSISSIQLISKLRYAKINCSIKDIFQYRTIERLVDNVLLNTKRNCSPHQMSSPASAI